MIEASVYRAMNSLAFVPHGKAPSGWTVGRIDILTDDVNNSNSTLNSHLKFILEDYDSEGDESRFNTKGFNKLIAKITTGESYAAFLKHAASVSIVIRDSEVILEPMARSMQYKGFEGYKDITEVLPISSLDDGRAMQRILELLDEVLRSYELPS